MRARILGRRLASPRKPASAQQLAPVLRSLLGTSDRHAIARHLSYESAILLLQRGIYHPRGALTEIPSPPRRIILSLKRGFSAVRLLHARRSSGRPPFGLDEISAISVSKINSSSAPVDFIARSAFKRV